MSDAASSTPAVPDPEATRQAILSGDPGRALPALVQLREVEADQAVPLLLLGLEQESFIIRSLSCAGLGVKRTEEGWSGLAQALRSDTDANVRAEAANALVNYGVERAWPLLRDSFMHDGQWLVRCSILSALAEQPGIEPRLLLELARLAVADGDGTVRVGGAEILGRLVREAPGMNPLPGEAETARQCLNGLLQDPDHRVVAAALNGLQD
jgi:HEAT repeat protein